MLQLIEKAKKIRLVIFDVDGVLTSGVLSYSGSETDHKSFNVRDGQGIKMLQKTGVEVAIISARQSKAVVRRMQDLNITHVYQNQANKLVAYEELKQKLNLTDEQIAYVGDDLPDLPVLLKVGLSATVPEACSILKDRVHLVTKAKGGRGVARELCEMIMQAQGTYRALIDSYLNP